MFRVARGALGSLRSASIRYVERTDWDDRYFHVVYSCGALGAAAGGFRAAVKANDASYAVFGALSGSIDGACAGFLLGCIWPISIPALLVYKAKSTWSSTETVVSDSTTNATS